MDSRINGTTIHYVDEGDRKNPPLVFIHGFPFSYELWTPQIEYFKRDFRTIAYDVRGHGKSDVGDGQYTIELFVDDLIALLDNLAIKEATLCALSMGGYIALRAVERNPERIASLILADTGPYADLNEARLRRAVQIKSIKSGALDAFIEGFLKGAFTPESFAKIPLEVERIRKIIQANSPLGICGTLLALAARTDTVGALPKIKVPTLILVGEKDPITPPSLSESMHEKISSSELFIIPNSAHLSNLENPTEFNRLADAFLASPAVNSASR